jgi:hypothetical protein
MTEARPTHRHIPSGHAVFPSGYAATDLELLPPGYWAERDRDMQASAIRADATARILAIAPWHVQINDIRDPLRPGAAARTAQIDLIRQQANAALTAIGVINGND